MPLPRLPDTDGVLAVLPSFQLAIVTVGVMSAFSIVKVTDIVCVPDVTEAV